MGVGWGCLNVHRFFISIPFIGITRKYMPNLTFIIHDPFNPSSLSFSRPQDYSCAHFLLINRKIIHANISLFYRAEDYSCAHYIPFLSCGRLFMRTSPFLSFYRFIVLSFYRFIVLSLVSFVS